MLGVCATGLSEGVWFLLHDVQVCSVFSKKECRIYRYTKKGELINHMG